MNYRLLSGEQKHRNRRLRFRRNDDQKASRRREDVLLGLRDPVLLRAPFLTDSTAFALVTDSRLGVVRNVIRNLNRLAALPNSAQPAGVGRCIPRPCRKLWPRNRGSVPKLAAQFPNADQFLGTEKALQHASDLLSTHDPAQILYFLTMPNAIGLAPSGCAELASQAGLIFSSGVIRKVEQALAFDKKLAVARAAYLAMATAGELTPAKGDWAFFDSAALHATLVGLHLPHVLRRDAFLVRLRYRDKRIICLDVHSLSYRPLCRHPVD